MGQAKAVRSLNLWAAVPVIGLGVGAIYGLVRGWPYFAAPYAAHSHKLSVLLGFSLAWSLASAVVLMPVLALILFTSQRIAAWARRRRERGYIDAEFVESGAVGPSWKRPLPIVVGLFRAFWGPWKWFMFGVWCLYVLALYFGPKVSPDFRAPPPPVHGDPTTAH